MTWDRIAENWKQAKSRVEERWRKVDVDDLDSIAGRRDLLLGRIQSAYGIGSDEAEKQLGEWEARWREETA